MKKLLVIIMIVTLTFAFTACGSDEEKVLKIGYTVYEPMNYYDEDGNFTGFDTELAIAVCEKIGYEPEFIEINWDTKVIELDAGNIDCIWNGMTITDELLDSISISEPYVKNAQVMIKKDGAATDVQSTEDMIGKTVVAEAGSAGVKAIEADENLKQAILVTVTKQTDALVEVMAGTADVAVVDLTLANAMIGEGTDFEDLKMVEGVELSVEEYGIGFRKDSELKAMVDEAIAELAADGTLAALAEKYSLNLAEGLK